MLLGRHPDHLRDDPHRQRLGIVGDTVDLVAVAK